MINNFPDNPEIEVLKAKRTGLFTNYIFKAIPLAFDESMSYYETLCALLHYLQFTIIPTVNNNAEAVAELQSLYVELHDYVEHYFDNLDVQDEINNKLDEMVESGELQEIISEYLNSKAVFGFDSVDELKSATNLIDGSYARTLGYYAVNDGGGALYKISEDEPSNYYELLESGLYAELVQDSDVINPLQYGAVNDGTTDNYTVLSNLLTKYDKILINGNFKISQSLTIGNNKTLVGNKTNKIIIPADGSTSLSLEGNNILIDGVGISASSTTFENNTNAISIKAGTNIKIANCLIKDCYNAIKVEPNENAQVKSLFIENNEITETNAGILLASYNEEITYLISDVFIKNNNIHDGVGEVASNSQNNAIKLSRLCKNIFITNNKITNYKADGIDGYKSGDTIEITNNEISNNAECGIELKDGDAYSNVLWGFAKNCIISNNIFINNAMVDLNLNTTPKTTENEFKQYKNTIINNNIFKNGVTAIKIATSNVEISNNIINDYSNYGLFLYDNLQIETSFKNINIHNNILNSAIIRIAGNNYYAKVYDNTMKAAENAFYNASPYVIVGDNNIEVTTGNPYINSNLSMVRETIHFAMIPFSFENVTEQVNFSQVAIPKTNRKLQILSAYVVPFTNTNIDGLTGNIKFGSTNQLLFPGSGDLPANTKTLLRYANGYTSSNTDDVIVNLYANANVKGYIMIFYAYA